MARPKRYFNSGPSKPHKPSPPEQVRLFDKTYGKDIHYPPPDPNAPDPGPVPGL